MIYISMLRGINVSGHKLIKMDALRTMFESLGFENVTSYLQSGNVVFAAKELDSEKPEQKISQQIEKVYGFEVCTRKVPATTRNWKTINELLRIAAAQSILLYCAE